MNSAAPTSDEEQSKVSSALGSVLITFEFADLAAGFDRRRRSKDSEETLLSKVLKIFTRLRGFCRLALVYQLLGLNFGAYLGPVTSR